MIFINFVELSLSRSLDKKQNQQHGGNLSYLLNSYFLSSETECITNEEKYFSGNVVPNKRVKQNKSLAKYNKRISLLSNRRSLKVPNKKVLENKISIIDVLGCYLESGNYNTDIRRSVHYLKDNKSSNKLNKKHSKISRNVIYVDRRKTELLIKSRNVKKHEDFCVVMEINL